MAHEKFIMRIKEGLDRMKKPLKRGSVENFHTSREKRSYDQGVNIGINIALRILEGEEGR